MLFYFCDANFFKNIIRIKIKSILICAYKLRKILIFIFGSSSFLRNDWDVSLVHWAICESTVIITNLYIAWLWYSISFGCSLWISTPIQIKVKIENLISMIYMTMTITLKVKRLIIVRSNKNLILVLMIIFRWLSQAQLRMFWILRAIEHNFGLYLFVIL